MILKLLYRRLCIQGLHDLDISKNETPMKKGLRQKKSTPAMEPFFFVSPLFFPIRMTTVVQRKESSAVRPPPPYSFPSAEIVGIESGRFVCALFICVCVRGFKFVCGEQVNSDLLSSSLFSLSVCRSACQRMCVCT